MIELALKRHEITDWNLGSPAEKRMQGHIDVPLNSQGMLDADNNARDLSQVHFDVILSSDMQRCFYGANAQARYAGMQAIADPRWRERDFGNHAGHTLADIGYTNPSYRDISHHFYNCDCPNGEFVSDYQARVRGALEDTFDEHDGQKVMVHTHSGVIVVGMNVLFGEEIIPENARRTKNGCVSYLFVERDGKGFKVVDSLINIPYSEIPKGHS